MAKVVGVVDNNWIDGKTHKEPPITKPYKNNEASLIAMVKILMSIMMPFNSVDILINIYK